MVLIYYYPVHLPECILMPRSNDFRLQPSAITVTALNNMDAQFTIIVPVLRPPHHWE